MRKHETRRMRYDIDSVKRSREYASSFKTALHESLSPFGTVNVMELFEHDLDFLSIWCTLGNQVKTLFVDS